MKKFSTIAISPASSVSAAGTVSGAAVDLSDFQGMCKLILNSSAMGGTSTPSSSVKIQHSVDGSTAWSDVSGLAFDPVTTTASLQAIDFNVDALHKFARAVDVVTGTSPTQAYSVELIGKKQSVA